MNNFLTKNKKAFTLIELVIVLVSIFYQMNKNQKFLQIK